MRVEFVDAQPVDTVRGDARILIRPSHHEAGSVLRLRRYLPHLSLLRYRDLAQDGSVLGSERDALILPNDDPRLIECEVTLPPGAETREYRLAWELNPEDHPQIGVSGEEMLLFRAYLLDRGADGAEEIREQHLIRIQWVPPEDPSTAFHRWRTSARTPEPLREALQALLEAEVQTPRTCELCHARKDLDLLLAQDRVWECSTAPELEEIRRVVVLRELTGFERAFADTLRTRHEHEDLSEQLAAARERRRARLAAHAPPGTEDVNGD